MSGEGENSGANLRQAWESFMAELSRARDAIDDPNLLPAPANDRNLAEGYRYLLGYLHSGIERAFFSDTQFPIFRHAIQPINKATIDNADAIYFLTAVDGRVAYWIRGEVSDARHWRGESPTKEGPKAPQYMIFEASDGCLAGDSGSLAELRPGVKVQTGRIDSTEIEIASDGSFEILFAPEKPPGFQGNFLCSHRRTEKPHPDEPNGSTDRYAVHLSGRQLFYDWARERPARLTLTRVDSNGDAPAVYTSERASEQLADLGALVRGQMHFWNQFYTILLETYGKHPGGMPTAPKDERFMPRNRFNAPNAASGATGGGQSTNIYAGGVYELAPDEALIVHSEIAVEPEYIGFHLSNLWGESHDFANHQSSLNGFQADREPDGGIYWVVAHRDPGVANWVDTTGHPEGFMAPRWAYSKTPAERDWPKVSAKKVPLSAIREHLPEHTRVVTAAERAEAIAIRQGHVLRRYRSF